MFLISNKSDDYIMAIGAAWIFMEGGSFRLIFIGKLNIMNDGGEDNEKT